MKVAAVTASLLVSSVIGKSQPECDWVDTLLISGDNENYEEFYLTCNDGLLTSVTNTDAGAHLKANLNNNDVYCDWVGPGKLKGIYDCDDFNFECYSNVLYGMKTVESEASCPSLDFAPFSSSLDGVVCNFATAIRTSGTNYVNFAIDCQNGTIDALYYDSSTSAPLIVGEKQRHQDSDSPTCTTWATATGSWELLHEHNQDFTYQFTYGTESSDTSSTSSEWATSLQESFSAGCLFAHYSVSLNISESISQTVSSSTTIDYSSTTTVPCSSPNGQNEGGALYQWVMATQHVDETSTTTTVFSDTTICVEFEGQPLCPLDACADELCQTCIDWESDTNSTQSGFQIGSCNWGASVLITGQHGNGFTFDCNSDKMDGIAGSGDYLTSDNKQGRTIDGDTVTTCSSCDWEGPKSFAGPNDCDDALIECYDGFIYGVTFVGDTGRFKASGCRDLVKPNDEPLTGTLCNWDDNTDYTMQDVNSNSNIHMFCNEGIIPTYQFLT